MARHALGAGRRRGRRVIEAGGADKLGASYRAACAHKLAKARAEGASRAELERAAAEQAQVMRKLAVEWGSQEATYRATVVAAPVARARSSRGRASRSRGSRRCHSRGGDSGDGEPGESDLAGPSRSSGGLIRLPRWGRVNRRLAGVLRTVAS